MTYYERNPHIHLDGTAIFQNAEDRGNETAVAERIGTHWNCNVRSFGMLSPIDWYAERHGRLIGLLELKSRSHDHDRYPTVFLNVRKWLALSLGSIGLSVPGVFVINFADGIFWVPLSSIDTGRHRIAGCRKIVKSVNDIEPIIEIDVGSLERIKEEE